MHARPRWPWRTTCGQVYVCNWHSYLGNCPVVNMSLFKTLFFTSPLGIHNVFLYKPTIIFFSYVCQKAHWRQGQSYPLGSPAPSTTFAYSACSVVDTPSECPLPFLRLPFSFEPFKIQPKCHTLSEACPRVPRQDLVALFSISHSIFNKYHLPHCILMNWWQFSWSLWTSWGYGPWVTYLWILIPGLVSEIWLYLNKELVEYAHIC